MKRTLATPDAPACRHPVSRRYGTSIAALFGMGKRSAYAVDDGLRLATPDHTLLTGVRTPPRLSPEQHLMLAVLEDALHCLRGYSETSGPRARSLHSRALAWFFSSDRGLPFTFERICEALDRDPETLRKRLSRELRLRPFHGRQ